MDLSPGLAYNLGDDVRSFGRPGVWLAGFQWSVAPGAESRECSIMAKLRLLKTGHGDLMLAEWDKDRPETVAAAESAFAENFTAGRLAFRLDGPGRTTPIRQFDRTAGEILIVPAIQGGSRDSV